MAWEKVCSFKGQPIYRRRMCEGMGKYEYGLGSFRFPNIACEPTQVCAPTLAGAKEAAADAAYWEEKLRNSRV